MDYFNNNKNDNSKQNEALLDIIMQEQKKRENKHNLKKGYLLNKKTGTVLNPFERAVEEDSDSSKDFKHAPVNTNSSEPVFVVNGGTVYGSKKALSKKAKSAIAISIVMSIILIVATFCCVFFLTKHNIEIVCGNINGINILNEKEEPINNLSLKMYETAKFKLVLNEFYSDSQIDVLYDDKEIKPDEDGYYTIQYLGQANEIRIMGVVENNYNINFSDSDLKLYKINANGSTELLNGKKITNYYGNKLKFKVESDNHEVLSQTYGAVYNNGKLLTPNANNIYELDFNLNQEITAYNHSPFEYFIFKEILTTPVEGEEPQIAEYELTGISEMGIKSQILCFPNKYNNKEIKYVFDTQTYYTEIKEIFITSNSSMTESDLNYFIDLQKINVTDFKDGVTGYKSVDGILYYYNYFAVYAEGERTVNLITSLVKVPSGYGKSLAEGERILEIKNANTISSNAFYRVNYIKTVKLDDNVSLILPLAFKGTNNDNEYTIEFINNENFKVENNIIYSADGSEIISAPFYKGEFVVPAGITIKANAFSFSGITSLKFEGTATVENQGLAMMEQLTKIELPSNIGDLITNILFGNRRLQVIDLRNVGAMVSISDLAIENWGTIQKIVVPDSLLESYKTANAEKVFKNLFVSVSEFDAV